MHVLNLNSNKKKVIEISKLEKHFNGKKVLDIDSTSIYSGEMVALLGSSGAGKSTLIRHLSGLVTADLNSSSMVLSCGHIIQKSGKLSRNIRKYRRDIGLIFQQFNLVNRMTAIDNVLVGALGKTPFWRTFFKRFTKEQRAEAISALSRVGMESCAYQRVSTLSGGQQQRVAIARVLMQGAPLILADEPIASLDPESSKKVMSILKEICIKDNITVVVTLHQVEHALEYCDRVIALQDGSIFYDGKSKSISKDSLDCLYKSKKEIKNIDMEDEALELKRIAYA